MRDRESDRIDKEERKRKREEKDEEKEKERGREGVGGQVMEGGRDRRRMMEI